MSTHFPPLSLGVIFRFATAFGATESGLGDDFSLWGRGPLFSVSVAENRASRAHRRKPF